MPDDRSLRAVRAVVADRSPRATPSRRFGQPSGSDKLTASQARATRRREARRDESATANWLREIANRPN